SRDSLSSLPVRNPNRHLQPRPLGQVTERLEALYRHSRRFIPGPTVEFDREQPALASLRRRLERRSRLVVEGGRDELAAAVAERSHHVAAPFGGSPPTCVLDKSRHARSDTLALRDLGLSDFAEGLHFVRGK